MPFLGAPFVWFSFLSVSSFGRCCFTTTTTSNRAGQFLRFHGGVTSFAASRTATSCRWLSGSRCLDGSKQNQLHLAEEAIASLAVTGRTWKRLGPVVSLATAASSTPGWDFKIVSSWEGITCQTCKTVSAFKSRFVYYSTSVRLRDVRDILLVPCFSARKICLHRHRNNQYRLCGAIHLQWFQPLPTIWNIEK